MPLATNQNEAIGLNNVTKAIYNGIKEVYINIEDRKDLKLFDMVAPLFRNDAPKELYSHSASSRDRFELEQSISNGINALRSQGEEKIGELKTELLPRKYFYPNT